MGRRDELQAAVASPDRGSVARDELVEQLLAVDVPVAPVLDRRGMAALGHFRARAAVTADPWSDPASGYPVRFVERPAGRVTPPPGLDEHRGTTWR